MHHVTHSVQDKKLPLFKNLLSALGLGNKSERSFLQKADPSPNSTDPHNHPNHSFFNKNLTWEYFSNELEFE